jgi:hypothetical protein
MISASSHVKIPIHQNHGQNPDAFPLSTFMNPKIAATPEVNSIVAHTI